MDGRSRQADAKDSVTIKMSFRFGKKTLFKLVERDDHRRVGGAGVKARETNKGKR